MNRQQRREAARRIAYEKKYHDEIIDRQNRVDDRIIELNVVCIGLAILDEYGFMPERINRIVTAYCKRMMQLDDGRTYEELRDELKDKTGVVFKWKR